MSNQQAATEVIECLQRHGFQALLAGGCVVVNLEEHVAAGVKTDAVPAALP